ncbi:peptide synthetase [Streptomyces lincolnensis]|uniref:Peptide synthetase n=1 Tax=Streptomyces lincolnensis TaxID=1915 RepID=A0A1B1MHK8_STRLN|nr:non-ribosomal peptide synthetase [Streptomyces lincolnensis]ANS68116.1 peptide synthetase [Streptomyces lincolnensis]AXG53678.1 peptide synthetase [Streptomyces lincolnensis]QMV09763.1 non-ribosomal peptide synthetase [Streptomyces lincolnensis]
MSTDTPHQTTTAEDWAPLLDEALRPTARPPGAWTDASFGALGGSSLQAYHLVALGERRLGRAPDLPRLLSDAPLGEVLTAARPVDARPAPPPPPGDRPLLPGQEPMLTAHLAGRDAAYRLMFSLTAPDLDSTRVAAALRALTTRHESLRTRFATEGDTFVRRVLPQWRVPLRELELPAGPGDPATRMEALLAPAAGGHLRPFEQPPWCAFVGRSAEDDDVLTLLLHHTIADGWSVGVLLREFAEFYGTPGAAAGSAPVPDSSLSRYRERAGSGRLADDLGRVAERLADAPAGRRLPGPDGAQDGPFDPEGGRLPFVLPPDVRDAVEAVARRAGVRRPVVLLAAWALVLGRRAGTEDLVLGMPTSGRFRAGQFDAVGLLTRVAPLRIRLEPGHTVADHLRATAAEHGAALRDSEAPYEDVVRHLAAHPVRGSNAPAPFAFAAHDELVPATVDLAGTPAAVTEGHCRGAVFDAILYLRRWGSEPALALEYSVGTVGPRTAAALAGALLTTLREFAQDPDAPIGPLTGLSAVERARVTASARPTPPAADGPPGLWDRFAATVERCPDAVAVTDPAAGHTLTYRQLDRAAARYAAVLRRAGVGAGDRVIVQVDRSAAEVVAVLALLRTGACYVPVPRETAADWRTEVLRVTGATVAVTSAGLRGDWPERVRPVAPWAPDPAPDDESQIAQPQPQPQPRTADSTAYVSFTSGTTGTPKGVEVPDRAVIRLATDPDLLRAADDEDPGRRRSMLRMAPLAFDASTLELFHPLLNGDRVTILPPGPAAPREIGAFLREEGVTHAWLTAGLFRLMARHEAAALGALRQVLTGGDVVSPAHVRTVMEAGPGLRVTNGYGPTENTTFTTVHHVTSAEEVGDTVPIGRPVNGTGVLVADEAGRPVPPGVDGELYATGLGLAHGYAGDAGRTAAAFVTLPWLAGERAYATGDVVRWDDTGRLLFRGRRDRQIKVRGHRVELAAIEAHLRARPGVVDAHVSAVGTDDSDETDRAVLAAVVGPPASALRELVTSLADTFPPYARPALWCLVPSLPLNHNGKVDTAALAARAQPTERFLTEARETDQAREATAGQPSASPEPAVREPTADDLVEEVAGVWRLLLGGDDFDYDEAFFDAGGDSLQLTEMRDALRKRFPGVRITSVDIYRAPTVNRLAAHIKEGLRGA